MFNTLWAYQHRIQQINQECQKLAREIGADDQPILLQPGYAAGGILGFSFPQKPRGWKTTRRGDPTFYYPQDLTPSNREILEKISELPKLTYMEISTTIGFEFQFVGDKFLHRIGIKWFDDYILIHIPGEAHYTPAAGMEEIKVSLYQKLYKEPASLSDK
ncbi:hypothetical protein GCM10027299_09260 [Larkinella ripae]